MSKQHYVGQYNESEQKWEVIAIARTGSEASHIMNWESRFSGWEGQFISGQRDNENWESVLGGKLHFSQSTVDDRERQRYENLYPMLPAVKVTVDHANNSTKRDELVERVADILGLIWGPGDTVTAKQVSEIVDVVTAARDAEIVERLLSDKAKNASAREMQELSAQGVIQNHTLAFYGMIAALDAVGLGDGTGGKG